MSDAPPPSTPDDAALSIDARRDRVGLAGYGCLVAASVACGLGGVASGFLGLAALVRGSQGTLRHAEDAHALGLSLERAVGLVGLGALLVLIAIVCAVVLVKELGDDSARRERGAVRG
jgi:hypothetical protein